MAEVKEESESNKRVIYTYPMVKQTDMADFMKNEVIKYQTFRTVPYLPEEISGDCLPIEEFS